MEWNSETAKDKSVNEKSFIYESVGTSYILGSSFSYVKNSGESLGTYPSITLTRPSTFMAMPFDR